MRKLLGIAAAAAAAILGWGYWHFKTHAAVNISLSPRGIPVELVLFDESGNELARARTTGPYNVTTVLHPEVGDCSGREWQPCFETVSKWVPTWVRRVRTATVQAQGCRLERIPVAVREYGDTWWVWWVPLPHIGGRPYGYFDIAIQVDPAHCAPQDK